MSSSEVRLDAADVGIIDIPHACFPHSQPAWMVACRDVVWWFSENISSRPVKPGIRAVCACGEWIMSSRPGSTFFHPSRRDSSPRGHSSPDAPPLSGPRLSHGRKVNGSRRTIGVDCSICVSPFYRPWHPPSGLASIFGVPAVGHCSGV